MQKVRNFFVQMGFKRQLILAFIATTVMTLIISIVVIKTQIASMQSSTEAELATIN